MSPFPTRPNGGRSARRVSLQRTGQQFHFFNRGYADFEDFLAALASRKRKTIRKRARARRLRSGHRHRTAHRRRHNRSALGRLLRFLHGHRRAQMGPALSHPRRSSRRSARRWPSSSCWCMAKRDGRHIAGRDQFHRRRRALRPQLGRARGASLPAFRGLLLSGDRIRHRARPAARRGRRAGRAQAGARLCAGADLFGA